MGLVATIVPSRQGDIRSPLAAGGVFRMPGYITEGPVRRISGPADWTVPPGAAAAIIRGNTNAMFSGAQLGAQFNPYGWRPSGDGTGAYWPHDRDYRRIYGYLPYQEGFMGAAAPQTLEEQVAAEVMKTQVAVRRSERWKLILSGVSTLALVTLTVAAIAGGRKK